MKKRRAGRAHSNWTCPTCNTPVQTPFCPTCGEQALRSHDLTLRVVFDQLVEAFTNVDSKLLRSFRYLLGRPGFLTDAFLKGQRKAYLGPVGLFLICNVLYFVAESQLGGSAFGTPLKWHLKYQPWSNAIKGLVEHEIALKHTNLESYAPVFDQAIAAKAHSLIILMALGFSLAPALLFLRSGRQLVAHVVFSLHLYAFLLLLLSLATAIPAVTYQTVHPPPGSLADKVVSIGLLIACAAYLYAATARVYGERGLSRAIKTVVLTVVAANVTLGYRFLLLLITLYST